MRIGEQHGQPIDPDALASRRRQPIAERPKVVLVNVLGHLLATLRDLLPEALLLLGGIVQLRVGVAQLEPPGKDFKPLGERGIVIAALGEGREIGGKIVNQCRLDRSEERRVGKECRL